MKMRERQRVQAISVLMLVVLCCPIQAQNAKKQAPQDAQLLNSNFHQTRGAHRVAASTSVPTSYHISLNGIKRSISIPKPGHPSPNLQEASNEETGPVMLEHESTPMEIAFGTGKEKSRRGKPLLSDNRISESAGNILISEDRFGDLAKKKPNDTGGADAAPPVIFGSAARKKNAEEDKEVSAQQVNAIAFSSAVEDSKTDRVYVAPRIEKAVLGTAEFHRFMGNNFHADKRWSECINEYDRVLALDPCDELSRTYRAEAKWMIGRRKEATEDFKAVRKSSNSEIRFIYANWLRETGKNAEAIAEYKIALSKNDAAKIWNNLGVAYMNDGESEKARSAFEKALAIEPTYAKSLLNMGILYDDLMEDPKSAIPFYEQYIRASNNIRRGEVAQWLATAKKEQEK